MLSATARHYIQYIAIHFCVLKVVKRIHTLGIWNHPGLIGEFFNQCKVCSDRNVFIIRPRQKNQTAIFGKSVSTTSRRNTPSYSFEYSNRLSEWNRKYLKPKQNTESSSRHERGQHSRIGKTSGWGLQLDCTSAPLCSYVQTGTAADVSGRRTDEESRKSFLIRLNISSCAIKHNC